MKMTPEEFETKIKDMIVSSVKPLIEAHGKEQSEKITTEIDTKVEEMVKELVPSRKSPIILGDEELEKNLKGGFKSISHFASDVAKAYQTGFRFVSKELEKWESLTRKIDKAAGTPSQNESDSEVGGYLIPPEFRHELLLAVEQTNDILPRCMSIPMATASIRIPYVNGFDESGGLVYGGIEWLWLDEEEGKTGKKVKFGRIALSLKKVAGLAYASDEILEDSPQSMENILKKGFRDGLNYQFNKVFLKGTGAGQPLGILNAPCLVSVAAETGQAASTIIFENIVKMYSRVSDISGAVWLANSDTLPQLATMSLAVGTGGVPVWLPANGASGVPYNTLMGLPLFFNKHCKTVGTVGDLVLCDWSQYLVGQKSGQGADGKFDTSIHLKFDYDQTAFRFVFRIDGQPWWPSALTPPESSDTISPFVSLASRT